MERHRKTHQGFVLIEALAAAATMIVACAVLALAVGHARKNAGVSSDLNKLRWLGSVTASYAADYDDRFWGFTWSADDTRSSWGQLNNADTDLQAAANQAIDIIRRRSGISAVQRVDAWIPHLNYSHLVLADYLNLELPDPRFVASADGARQAWRADPADYQNADAPTPDDLSLRWPFSASFQMPPAFFSEQVAGFDAIRQGTTHRQWIVPRRATLGPRRVSDVAHPADKVFLHDTHGRYSGAPLFYAYAQAYVPVLSVDGSASLRRTGDTNIGWDPMRTVYGTTLFRYSPDAWEPPTSSGTSSDVVVGHYRFTSMGLGGRDLLGSEERP